MAAGSSNLASDLKRAKKDTSIDVFSKRLFDVIFVVLELKKSKNLGHFGMKRVK